MCAEILQVLIVVTGLIAAGSACYSARSAATTISKSDETEKRRITGLGIEAAQKVINENMRIVSDGRRLKSAYQMQSELNGAGTNALVNAYIDDINKIENESAEYASIAKSFISSVKSKKEFTEAEVVELLYSFNSYFGSLSVFKETLRDRIKEIKD